MHRPIPVTDELSTTFWQAAREGVLKVQRCQDCTQYFLPPVVFCSRCYSERLEYEPVSGGGSLYSFSEIRSGAREPFFRDLTPYVLGFVELDEQPGLFMYTNLPGAGWDDLNIGVRVQVEFERIDSENVIPQFRIVRLEGIELTS